MIIRELRLIIMVAFIIAGICGGAWAGKTIKIEWEDLLPKATLPKDPVESLPTDLQDAYENLQFWLSLTPQDKASNTPDDLKELKEVAVKARALFKQKGIDFDKLNERVNARQKVINKIERTTITKYNTKQISIAGYLLPLEFDNRGVKDFLLVPYVGACIHVPPPPINQTVFVHMKKRFEIKGLFDPVWVSGRMKNTQVQKNLSLVDGEGKVHAGYSLDGDQITPYTPPRQ